MLPHPAHPRKLPRGPSVEEPAHRCAKSPQGSGHVRVFSTEATWDGPSTPPQHPVNLIQISSSAGIAPFVDERRAVTNPQLTEGLQVAGRFRLVRELGKGGMGSVWLAEHMGLDVPCAVKFIDKDGRDNDEMRARFEREAKAAAALRSPNVVQILDYGVWESMPYLAMEYLEGEDLAQRLDRVWVLSPGEAVYVTGQVARALSKAHAAGIVHRDLKPENVYLTRDGDEEIVKVLDFGIAKRSTTELGDSGTKTGSLLGTPFYMSPEQARGVRAVDYRSDLWSLAVIVFQCLTGQLPFESEGLGDLLSKIMFERMPVPSTVKPDLPASFDAWWARAAARDPEERFQSAKELADELAVALGVTQRIQVAALSPRREQTSWVNLPAYRSDSGESSLQVTLIDQARSQNLPPGSDTDQPFARTFTGAGSTGGKHRRLAIVAGCGALVLLAVLGFAFVGSSPPSHTDPAPAGRAVAETPAHQNEPVVTVTPAPKVVDLDTVPAGSASAAPSASPSASTPPLRPASGVHKSLTGSSKTGKKKNPQVDFGI